MALPAFFDNGGDSEEESCKISINKKFAEKYHKFKECQELDALKKKYADVDEESSSTSESEDDDAAALTPQIDQDFLETLSMIKQKDPKIYEKDSIFFSNKDSNISNTNKKYKENKNEQPILLKDYECQRLLEKGDKAYLSDSDDGNEEIEKLRNKNGGFTYVQQQEQLKKSLTSAAQLDSDEDEGDLLQIRQTNSDSAKEELEKYVSEMENGNGNALNRYWNNDQLGNDEKFLRDYILKKQFIADKSSTVPAYNEIISGFEDDEASEGELDRAEDFERKYNFRYEEPDAEFIKQYPRTINESVRRKDERRIEQRIIREERKKKEQEKKKDELKRLKNLKRKEIMQKIEKLKEITGNKKVGFLEEDMENDFDMSKYDQLMEKVFDDEYYDDDNIKDMEKPVFPEEDGDEYYEDYENYEDEEFLPHCEDPEFNMDADYNSENKTKKSKQLSKRKTMNAKFTEAIQREKPLFDPQQTTFEDYFDEYYKLDFEDVIDDIPIRFKYREVIPNDFGLSVGEILTAENKELNEWCSIKKTMQYIGDDEERKQQQKFKKKARNKNKKLQVFSSLREELEEQPESTNNSNLEKISKTRNIKLLQKKQAKWNSVDNKSKHLKKKKTLISSWNNQYRRSILSSVNKSRVKNIRKRFKGGNDKVINKLSLERLAAYGLDERKKKSI